MRAVPFLLAFVLAVQAAAAQGAPAAAPTPDAPAPPPAESPLVVKLRTVVAAHLGKPYVWGATGLKSFDCSGFLWRVMTDAGVLVKRTTARKYYMCLPKVDDSVRGQFGTVVFFDCMKHCGIVADAAGFYHAQLSRGTNLSPLRPYWRPKVCGYRGLPAPGAG
jgi:cell wall-associated NlpC family hydrolase